MDGRDGDGATAFLAEMPPSLGAEPWHGELPSHHAEPAAGHGDAEPSTAGGGGVPAADEWARSPPVEPAAGPPAARTQPEEGEQWAAAAAETAGGTVRTSAGSELISLSPAATASAQGFIDVRPGKRACWQDFGVTEAEAGDAMVTLLRTMTSVPASVGVPSVSATVPSAGTADRQPQQLPWNPAPEMLVSPPTLAAETEWLQSGNPGTGTEWAPKVSATSVEVEENVEWVHCEADGCGKWRILPPYVKAETLPEFYICSMSHWLGPNASCLIPGDVYEAEEGEMEAQEEATPLGARDPMETVARQQHTVYIGDIGDIASSTQYTMATSGSGGGSGRSRGHGRGGGRGGGCGRGRGRGRGRSGGGGSSAQKKVAKATPATRPRGFPRGKRKPGVQITSYGALYMRLLALHKSCPVPM